MLRKDRELSGLWASETERGDQRREGEEQEQSARPRHLVLQSDAGKHTLEGGEAATPQC